jgi:hypothetical protein
VGRALTSLQVFNNQLKWLPPELGHLAKLDELWVRRSRVLFLD